MNCRFTCKLPARALTISPGSFASAAFRSQVLTGFGDRFAILCDYLGDSIAGVIISAIGCRDKEPAQWPARAVNPDAVIRCRSSFPAPGTTSHRSPSELHTTARSLGPNDLVHCGVVVVTSAMRNIPDAMRQRPGLRRRRSRWRWPRQLSGDLSTAQMGEGRLRHLT